MAFETVVRPSVFPNIRPGAAQVSSAPSTSGQGMATIHGASGRFLDLAFSITMNSSRQTFKEKKRRVDEVRVKDKRTAKITSTFIMPISFG